MASALGSSSVTIATAVARPLRRGRSSGLMHQRRAPLRPLAAAGDGSDSSKDSSPKEAGSFGGSMDDAKYRTGYMDSDSAGQSNVFGVEPKMYVAGSSADSTSGANQGFTLQSGIVGLGAILAAVAASFIVAGYANVDGDLGTEKVAMQDKSLRTFVEKFESELKNTEIAASGE